MDIRKATSEDLNDVVDVLRRSRQEYLPFAQSPHSPENIRQWVSGILIPTERVMLAEMDSAVVGVLATSISNKIGWVDQLYLSPGQIRRGIGSTLLQYALDDLPRPVRLWTFQQNHRAIGFYEHHGFKAIQYTDGSANEEKCPDILFELL